jgi:hypothetical protein
MTTAHRSPAIGTPAVEQLALFPESTVPERFRLDEATRRRGLRHIAELRARLEARYPSPPEPAPTPAATRAPLGSRAA